MNENNDRYYPTEESLIKQTQYSLGKKMSAFCNNETPQNRNKGGFGQFVQENVFGIKNNSLPDPDVINLGIEIKTAGYKRLKNGSTSIKERLVLSDINYRDEGQTTFEKSSFCHKDLNLLLLFYEYSDDNSYDYLRRIISNYSLYKLMDQASKEDLEIIKQDWELIHQKIANNQEANISESDTNYLAACTKSQNSSVRTTGFNGINKVKPRAYCYKRSFINKIFLESLSANGSKAESLLKDEDLGHSFAEVITNRLKKVGAFDYSFTDLCQKYSVNVKSKQAVSTLLSRMLGLRGNINSTDEFEKANIESKTIRIEENGFIEQSMSFENFDFCNLCKQKWTESPFYKTFSEKRFLFVCLKNNGQDYYFYKIFIWNMPESILNTYVYEVWKKTRDILQTGSVISGKKQTKDGKEIVLNNFPGMGDSPIFHIRPKGLNKKDVAELPKRDKLTGQTSFTKQCYWLKNTYIRKIIECDGNNDVINTFYLKSSNHLDE
ncbi:MAG: hypothetical protein LKJ88_02040 [Bacilli bacterium]|jgi:DNA mismatch repair protein MutH|nr:hypothetical protein [Bacilli bacterium]